jgi:Flp pilus assembly protein TadD
MAFTFNPESRLHVRTGQAAVAVLLSLVFFGLIGCDAPIGDRNKKDSVPDRPAPTAERDSWVAPTVPEPEPVAEVESEPTIPEDVSFEDAEAAYRERRYGDAVDLFTVYSEHHPDDAWGHYMLGLSARLIGNLEQAEASFERALELDPNHVKSMLNLSRVLLDDGRPEEALAQLDVALDIDPASDDGYRLRGIAYYDLGRDEDAIDSFHEAISVNEQDAWSMNNLALVLIRQEKFDEALLPLARATELREDVAVFQNNLGIALERTGYVAASREAYRSALELDEGYEKASVSLARVEELKDEAGVDPVNLASLALTFTAEIETWQAPLAKVPQQEEIEQEQPDGSEPEETTGPQSVSLERDSVGVTNGVTIRVDTTKVNPDTSGTENSM